MESVQNLPNFEFSCCPSDKHIKVEIKVTFEFIHPNLWENRIKINGALRLSQNFPGILSTLKQKDLKHQD